MNKQEQLERAKRLAVLFLNLPIKETEFGALAIQHPFFESAFLFDGEEIFNALEEQDKYREYRSLYEKKCIGSCENVSELLQLVRKSYRLTYLSFLRKEKTISLRECGNLLAEQWDLLENVSHDNNVRKSTVLSWIRAADKTALMNENEIRKFEMFSDALTIYRGCCNSKGIYGMSWTISEEKARWFAARWNKKGGLTYRAQVRKEDIICFLTGRGEQEVIVDYRKLSNLERI